VIRYSQSYLFGAISGTAVIAAAVVFFVLFVSAQALRDWPISDLSLGGGGDSSSVSPAQPVTTSGGANGAAADLSGPVTGASAVATDGAAKATTGGTDTERRGQRNARVAPQSQIDNGRGVSSAPISEQPSSGAPAPAPSTGSTPPAGSGTASPTPSDGGGAATGGGGNTSAPAVSGVGTRAARQVAKTVREISGAATPPARSPVTQVTDTVADQVSGTTAPSSGNTVDKVKDVVAGIGD
jgi:hypothetical protein